MNIGISEMGTPEAVAKSLAARQRKYRKELTKAQSLGITAIIAAVKSVTAPAVTVTGTFGDGDNGHGGAVSFEFRIETHLTFRL